VLAIMQAAALPPHHPLEQSPFDTHSPSYALADATGLGISGQVTGSSSPDGTPASPLSAHDTSLELSDTVHGRTESILEGKRLISVPNTQPTTGLATHAAAAAVAAAQSALPLLAPSPSPAAQVGAERCISTAAEPGALSSSSTATADGFQQARRTGGDGTRSPAQNTAAASAGAADCVTVLPLQQGGQTSDAVQECASQLEEPVQALMQPTDQQVLAAVAALQLQPQLLQLLPAQDMQQQFPQQQQQQRAWDWWRPAGAAALWRTVDPLRRPLLQAHSQRTRSPLGSRQLLHRLTGCSPSRVRSDRKAESGTLFVRCWQQLQAASESTAAVVPSTETRRDTATRPRARRRGPRPPRPPRPRLAPGAPRCAEGVAEGKQLHEQQQQQQQQRQQRQPPSWQPALPPDEGNWDKVCGCVCVWLCVQWCTVGWGASMSGDALLQCAEDGVNLNTRRHYVDAFKCVHVLNVSSCCVLCTLSCGGR
jgi:hypothetical protein